MMLHLDIKVDDLDAAGAHAVAAGAVVAEYQPQDDARVHLDPAGYPFCLYLGDQLRWADKQALTARQDGRIRRVHLSSSQAGCRLARVPSHMAYWFAWYAFFPQTSIYGLR